MMQELKFNRAQQQFLLRLPGLKGARNVWSRATGKSSVIYLLMRLINRTMPRAAWVLQGQSYQQILTRTLPGTLGFAEQIGAVRGRDFVLGSFPNKEYALPYQVPLKPDHCLFLLNHQLKTSVVFTLFSQDKKTSSRGPNRDGIITDETLLLDWEKYSMEAKATNRGNLKFFGHLPYHHGEFHFTSMPDQTSPILSSADHYNQSSPELFLDIDKRIDLQLAFLEEKDKKIRLEIWREIMIISERIKFYPSPAGVLHSEYNVFDNLENLGIEYIDSLFQDTPLQIFLVEVLNKRMYNVVNSFYPQLNRAKHVYYGHFDYGYLDSLGYDFEKLQDQNSLQDADCNPNEPLCIGMDFGTAINWIIVGQEIKARKQFNFIKDFYVKPPKTFLNCVEDFCNYYRHHKNKTVFVYPDGEGNVKRANLEGQPTYVDQVRKVFAKHGWTMFLEKTAAFNPDHHNTFLLWDSCLSEQTPDRFPRIRFNAIHCKSLLFSMEQTPSKNIGPRIIKIKKSEEKLIFDREKATDAGDAADQILINRFGYLLKNNRPPIGTPGHL
jgi:hypothetical protein